MLKIINLQDTPTSDPSSGCIKFSEHGSLPILELETPYNKSHHCRYCHQKATALVPLVWVCCCDGEHRFAHEKCLKEAMFSSIRQISEGSAAGDHESWRRCEECYVTYRIEFQKSSRFTCSKFQYNLSEHTAYVVLSIIVYVLLIMGLVLLCLFTTRTLMVMPEYSQAVKIGLWVGIAVQVTIVVILSIVFARAHWIVPMLSVAHIHGIDESFQQQELGLVGENLIVLDLNGVYKLVLIQ